MIDAHGRDINYLRLSVTRRCGLGCLYCGHEDRAAGELEAGQIANILAACARLGITKVRFTGGEPMEREDIGELIAIAKDTTGISEIAMTSNGQDLADKLWGLQVQGLDRINLSVDSLDHDNFARITGGGSLQKVVDTIEEALDIGMPVKINCVLMRGINDGEIPRFLELARQLPIDVRFIELMPMGGALQGRSISPARVLTRDPQLLPIAPRYPGQPAREYTARGYKGRIGLISPLSDSFCSSCSRIRITASGGIIPCLGNGEELELMSCIDDVDGLTERIKSAVMAKPAAHGFCAGYCGRGMGDIGGL